MFLYNSVCECFLTCNKRCSIIEFNSTNKNKSIFFKHVNYTLLLIPPHFFSDYQRKQMNLYNFYKKTISGSRPTHTVIVGSIDVSIRSRFTWTFDTNTLAHYSIYFIILRWVLKVKEKKY